MNNKRVVITYGTFDLFHVGHLNILQRARSLGDYLVVAVSTDDFNLKKNKKSFFNFEDRFRIVEACRYVDLVIPESDWNQKEIDIREHQVKTLVMGDDWSGRFDNLSNICEVKYLPRTPGISSTKVRELSNVVNQKSVTEELEAVKSTIDRLVSIIQNLT